MALALADQSSHSTFKLGHGPAVHTVGHALSHARPHHVPIVHHAPVHHAPVHHAVHHAPIVHHAPVHHAPAYKPAPTYDGPANYNFAYAVADDYSGVNFGHNEARDGYATNGQYNVLLPDGRTQTVTYTVGDDYSGYVADVQYSGEAKYAPAPAYKPAPAPYKPAPVYHPAPAPYHG